MACHILFCLFANTPTIVIPKHPSTLTENHTHTDLSHQTQFPAHTPRLQFYRLQHFLVQSDVFEYLLFCRIVARMRSATLAVRQDRPALDMYRFTPMRLSKPDPQNYPRKKHPLSRTGCEHARTPAIRCRRSSCCCCCRCHRSGRCHRCGCCRSRRRGRWTRNAAADRCQQHRAVTARTRRTPGALVAALSAGTSLHHRRHGQRIVLVVGVIGICVVGRCFCFWIS